MKVLSIDWDFFQNVSADLLRTSYPDGIDLPSSITEITWGGHYAANGDELRDKVTLMQTEYERLMKILLGQESNVPVLIANSHVHAYSFIHENLLDKNDKVELTNIDMHHDFVNKSEKVDCGNWIGKLAKENILKEDGLKWIHNPVSFEMYDISSEGEDEFSKLLHKLDKGTTLEDIENEQFDLIVLARSDTWSAPHLDKYFCLLADIIKEHFFSVSMENGIDKPRTAYLKYAVTMRDVYVSVKKKGCETA